MAKCKHLEDLGTLPSGEELAVWVEGDDEGSFLASLTLDSTDPAIGRKRFPHSEVAHPEKVEILLADGHFYQAFFFLAWVTEETSEVTIHWEKNGNELFSCTVSGSKSERVKDRAFWFDAGSGDA